MKLKIIKTKLATYGVGAVVTLTISSGALAETAMDLALKMQASGYTDVVITKMLNGNERVTGYVNGRKHDVEYNPDGLVVKNELAGEDAKDTDGVQETQDDASKDEGDDDDTHDESTEDVSKPKRGDGHYKEGVDHSNTGHYDDHAESGEEVSKEHGVSEEHRAPRDHGEKTSDERSDGKSTEARSGAKSDAKNNGKKNSDKDHGGQGNSHKSSDKKDGNGKDKGSEKSGGKKP